MQDVLVPAQHGRWLGENLPAATVVAEAGKGHLAEPATVLALLQSLANPA